MNTEVKDKVMWEGDWSSLDLKVCSGCVEIWDQTVGCPECGQNLWYLPSGPDKWPVGDEENCPVRPWMRDNGNPYDPYFRVFQIRHPFQFDDCHDPGDEDPNTEWW